MGRLIPKSDKDSSSDGLSTQFMEALAKYVEGDKDNAKLINLRGIEVQPALKYMQRVNTLHYLELLTNVSIDSFTTTTRDGRNSPKSTARSPRRRVD